MNTKTSVFFPVLLIVIGGLWFLNTQGFLPATNTIFACAFILVGCAIFVLEGINKSSIVSAPLIMYCGAAIYAKDHYYFELSAIISLGVALLGVLLLLAQSDFVPMKKGRKISQPNNNNNHSSQ